jgi:hypothetical protein
LCRSGVITPPLRPSRFVGAFPGKQLLELLGWMICDPGDEIGEILFGIDLI